MFRREKESKLLVIFLKPWVLILTLLLGIILVSSLSVALYFNHYLNSPASKDSKQIDFVVTSGEGVRAIAKDLDNKKLIEHDLPLLVYLKLSGLADNILAGNYVLNTNNTPLEIVDILTKGKVASVKITIPEGWTNEQIATYLDGKGVVKRADFLAATKLSYNYDFLKGLPAGADVEGFLFPDTYQIPFHTDSQYIINKMLENFGNRLTPEIRNEISSTNLNLFQTVTLASVVEKEVIKPEDRKTVAGIFLARIAEGTPLQSDATVEYYLKTNKKVLSLEDVQTPSPYNTYLKAGLPFGPISNPGLDAIQAVINPEKTDFRYFLSANGIIYYSKTLDEHNAKKAQYLNQ